MALIEIGRKLLSRDDVIKDYAEYINCDGISL